eukprot:NODE_1376_length_551_cov_17.772908_g1300_i0.p2 GENE.NODE_1376_length_551_cov_17.772908_g1300_i0~~NODE_1376_length_551_cov_17.772908_g1300_i0.p2  ORF type:complete len:66 (+),score=11.19 NODE_1376_length_551_cov_17.772908_g1300_i0:29-226(+)
MYDTECKENGTNPSQQNACAVHAWCVTHWHTIMHLYVLKKTHCTHTRTPRVAAPSLLLIFLFLHL